MQSSSPGDPIGGVFGIILDLSRSFPIIGMIASAGFAALSVYIQRLPSTLLGGRVHLFLIVTIPLACLCMLMAVVGFFTRRSEESARQLTTAAGLADLDPADFLQRVAQGYQRNGLSVSPPDSPDFDLLLRNKDGEELLVYCRYQSKAEVTDADLLPLIPILAARKTPALLLVLTCGQFAPSATEFVRDKDILLVDGNQLLTLTSASPAVLDPGCTPR